MPPYSSSQPDKVVKAAENLGEHLTGETIENSPYKVGWGGGGNGPTLQQCESHLSTSLLLQYSHFSLHSQLVMNTNTYCNSLCTVSLSGSDVAEFKTRIDQDYNVNFMVDGLPAAALGLLEDGSKLYARGIPIGGVERDTGFYFLYNHHKLAVSVHEDPAHAYPGFRVVGFDVTPLSVEQPNKVVDSCEAAADAAAPGMPAEAEPHMIIFSDAAKQGPVNVTFSYDVTWQPSEIQWASRWDIYLNMGGLYSESVHWFSIINSLIISVFLTGMVAMILVRALHADIARYNRVLTEEEKAEEREESGWKLVHGDVFRPPARGPMAFAVFVGIGTQLTAMAAVTLVFAAIGFLSPANRGSLMIALLLLFLTMGSVAGYTTARTHKMFNGTAWQRVTLITALGFTGFLFSALFILNLAVWSKGSTNAVQFSSMFAVLCLWLLVSVPLTFVGAYYGFKAEKVDFPVRVSSMPRQIPPQPWYLQTPLTMAIGGVLPFGTVFVELFFILTSIWLNQVWLYTGGGGGTGRGSHVCVRACVYIYHDYYVHVGRLTDSAPPPLIVFSSHPPPLPPAQYYYVFGFLLLVFCLLIITCAEISIVLTYFQLCAGEGGPGWGELRYYSALHSDTRPHTIAIILNYSLCNRSPFSFSSFSSSQRTTGGGGAPCWCPARPACTCTPTACSTTPSTWTSRAPCPRW